MSNQLSLQVPDFEFLRNAALNFVSPKSARVYDVTYRAWLDWCNEQQVDPLQIHYKHVSAFLQTLTGSKTSKQRALSALRTMAQLLATLEYSNPLRRASYETLSIVKIFAQPEDNERSRRALKPADADRMLRVWSEDETLRGKRNRGIVAVALLSGLRRAELTALKWTDIDLELGTIEVRHGKGDTTRTAALYGDEAIQALHKWQRCQPDTFEYVFVSLRKGEKFDQDKPLSTTSIWRIVDETSNKAGIEHVRPHILRRTLATELLNTGSPVHHVQQQLGHSNSSTTLDNYTAETDAIQRRQDGKLRYG